MQRSDLSCVHFIASRGARLAAGLTLALAFGTGAFAQKAIVRPAPMPLGAAPATMPAAPVPGTQPSGPAPIYRCDEPIYNFPEAWSGDIVEHTFIVHNDSKDAVLEIQSVSPTCGCTLAGQYDRQIQPKGEGKIPLKFNSHGYRDSVTKIINVKTNDPKNATPTLTLKGTVKPRFAMDPLGGINFGALSLNAKPQDFVRELTITNNTKDTPKFEIVKPQPPATMPGVTPIPPPPPSPFTYELKEIQAGKVYKLTVTADRAKIREGANSANVQITTGVTGEPQVYVPVNLFMRPLVEVSPMSVAVATPVTTPATRQVNISYNGDGKMEIKEAKCTDAAIKVQVQPIPLPPNPANPAAPSGPGRMYRVEVTVPEGYDPPMPQTQPAEVVVATDVKEKPEVRIRVQCYPQAVNADFLVGKPAPKVQLMTTDKKPLALGAGNGRVSVIAYWTSWCPHCKRMLPLLQRIAKLYANKDVDFQLVSLDQVASIDVVVKTAKDLGVTLPIAVDARQSSALKYGANRFPMTFVLGKAGIIEAVNHGAPENYETVIKAQVDLLLAGKTRADFPPAIRGMQQAATQPAPVVNMVPRLIVDSPQQDMGQVKPGAAGQYTLFLRNAGQQPLALNSVTASDDLKVDPGYAKTVQPNASVGIKCTYTAPKQPGVFRRTITIASNDPMRAQTVVNLSGTVRPFVQLDPISGVDFGRRPPTFSMDRMASLYYNGEGSINFLSAESNSPKFEARIQPIQRNPNNVMLIVTAHPPFDQGEHKAIITVKSDCKEQPVVQVPVTLFQPARVDVAPTAITISKMPRIQDATVSITNNGTSSIAMLDVKASSQKIHWQFYPEPDGMSYRLKVTLPAGFAAAPEGDKITVRTNDSEFGEIVIPIKVTDGIVPKAVSALPVP